MSTTEAIGASESDEWVVSNDPHHVRESLLLIFLCWSAHFSEEPSIQPANLIPELCKAFYHLGWVTGTGGGISIRNG